MEEHDPDASTTSVREVLSYRQRLEKPAGGEIVLMKWSPTMDLLAATFADKSVILNRLSWQRVWSLPAQDGTPTALAWRPDGKVLAVSRCDGKVSLHSVEEGRTLHTHTFTHSVTSMHWVAHDQASINVDRIEYKDRSSSFLPPLPPLDNSESSALPATNKSLSKEMDVLVIGDKAGVLHMCVGGVFQATSVGIGTKEGNNSDQQSHVIVTCMSHDLKLLSSIDLAHSAEQKSNLYFHAVEVSLLHQRCSELHHLALHHSHISSLLDYANATLRCMHEAWEDLLLMVDAKLARYSTTLQEGMSVADELLMLLACGRVRPELQDFLVDELTAKGVKKIGLSLEMSYTRVRKYSLTCLSSVIQALQFHLGEVFGMSQWYDRFGLLGISRKQLQVCLNSLGTFALKNHELQFVIDESLKCMKAFFTWLYRVILKLGEEALPPNMKEHLSAQDLKLVIHFLKKRLAKASEGSVQAFNLELVGQYLVDEDLKIVEAKPPSLWEKILEDAKLKPEAVPWLFSPSPKKSLLQLLNSLVQDINAAFATTQDSMKSSFMTKMNLPLHTVPMAESKEMLSKFSVTAGEFVSGGKNCIYFPCGVDIILLVCSNEQWAVKCCRFYIREVPALADQEKSEESARLLSLQTYNSEALSVLFTYVSSERQDILYSALAQLPVDSLIRLATDVPPGHNIECCEGHDVGCLLTQVHSLGPFHGTSLAVSGSRRLAAVVSCQSKKVRLFDVDAEEEEEEEEEREGEGEEGTESTAEKQ